MNEVLDMEQDKASICICELKANISQSENEIGQIFNEIQKVKQKNTNKKMLLESLDRKIQFWESKLHSYRNELKEILQKTKQNQEMQKLRNDIVQKTKEFQEFKQLFEATIGFHHFNLTMGISEYTHDEMRLIIQQLQSTKNKLIVSVKGLELQLENLREEELEMQQSIKILHKRNAAQLLRLKRLINEAQPRYQHRMSQVQKLQPNNLP